MGAMTNAAIAIDVALVLVSPVYWLTQMAAIEFAWLFGLVV